MVKERLSVTVDESVIEKLHEVMKKENRDMSNVVDTKLKKILGIVSNE